jgi:hypothetical protein
MNAIVLDRHNGTRGWLGHVWHAWQRLERRHWAYALLAAAIYAAVNLLWSLDYSESKKPVDAVFVAMSGIGPILTALMVVLAWAIADSGDDRRMARWQRVGLAVALAGGVACVLMTYLLVTTGALTTLERELAAKGEKLPPHWLGAVGDWISTMALFGLFVAFGEMHLARERIEAQARDVMRAQSKVAREVLESRLAAMQAQVEPQFLFDSLVDVRALYERAPTVGAATLDRLITYLRVALPRLRESGSTVEAEVQLVRAYVSVVAARHDGRPRLAVSVAPEAGEARFYPMLLLPLVQRAVRESAARAPALPAHISLTVRRASSHVVARLRFDAPGLCAEDSDLARVRQRLAGLYRGEAALECSEASPGQTEFALTVPYEHSHGDRR